MFIYNSDTNTSPFNFLKLLFLSVLATVGTFLMPISVGIEGEINDKVLKLLITLVSILSINSFSFSAFSEIVKSYSAKYRNTKKYGFFYSYYFEKKHAVGCSIIWTMFLSVFLVILYVLFNGIEHIKGLILYAICVCFSYSLGILAFYLIMKGDIGFRKRDYLLYKPFFTMSFPLSCGIYATDLFNGKLQYVSLLLLFCVYILLSYVLLKKKLLMNKTAFSVVNICIFALLIIIYVVVGFSKPGFVFNNINALVLSVCYGIYISGLLSLSYTVFFPVKTKKIRQSIVKFRTCLFNLAPAAAFPLLLYYFDNSVIIYLFIFVNIIAVNCSGNSENSYNILFTAILIIMFICTTLIMFQVDGFFIRSYKVKFFPEVSFLSLIISTILSLASLYIAIANKKNKNFFRIPNFVKRDFTYYFTSLIGPLVLLVIMSLLHSTEPENSNISSRSDFAVYVYVFASLIVCGGRFIYNLIESEKLNAAS